MAGLHFRANTGAVSVASATAKTVGQIVAATNTRALLRRMDIGWNGVTATDPPVRVELLIQTDAGSGSSAITMAKNDTGYAETLQTTGIYNCTSEPTGSTIVWGTYIHPQTSRTFVFDPPLAIVGGTRRGLRCTPGSMTGCSVDVTFHLEE